MKLKNKVVVVTGAGQGLGREIAESLAQEGAAILICDRNKGQLRKVCKKIIHNNGRCEYFVVDVTRKRQVEKFIDTVCALFKKIDVLINNAGAIHSKKNIERITDKDYELCFKANVESIFYFLRKVIPVMKRRRQGKIINISSMAGKRGHGQLSAYSASKFAVQGLTQSVAWELKGTNVSCISVCPGAMNTLMRKKIFGKENALKQQDPRVVANQIKKIVSGDISVPNGGDVEIHKGKITQTNDNLL